MSDVVTFSDIFKKSFMELFPASVDPFILIITMLAAFLIGLGIFMVYRRYFVGVVYDHSFSLSLVIMTILTSVIIVTISSNIALSLGMVGALSIVRYRTAVKNSLDLMFLFWAITTGIAVGAQSYLIALICFAFVTMVFVVLKRVKSSEKTYVLVINFAQNIEVQEDIYRFLNEYKTKLRSQVVKKDMTELTMEIVFKRENRNITGSIAEIEGVNDVTLVQYRGNYDI